MRSRLVTASLASALCGVLAAPATASAASPTADPGGDAHAQIIGGSSVTSAPWAAAVTNAGGFACSGTIIAPEWVLTATHCLDGTMSVRVGSANRSSGAFRGVTDVHSRYDVTLLRLAGPVTTTYMKLAEDAPPAGATTTLYGWGMTCFTGCGAPERLKKASVRITDTGITDHLGGPAIRSERINGHAWRGDSGGPQVYQGAQVGVASTADGQLQQNYSSVPASRSWIRTTAGV